MSTSPFIGGTFDQPTAQAFLESRPMIPTGNVLDGLSLSGFASFAWQEGLPDLGITGSELRGVVAATLAGGVAGYAFGHGIAKGALVGLLSSAIAAKGRG